MNRFHPSRLLLIGALACAAARLHAESADAILSRMNASARKFKAVSAAMHQTQFVALLKETENSDAQVRIRRTGSGFSGVLDYQKPEPRVVAFAGRSVTIYYPNANQAQKISAGDYLSHVSQFLLFGTSGDELQKTYSIAVAGTETIDSTPTTHLILTPKSPELIRMISKLEVWFPEDARRPYPLQERATEPSQNTELFSFSGVVINPSLPDSAFELKIPHGAKIITQR